MAESPGKQIGVALSIETPPVKLTKPVSQKTPPKDEKPSTKVIVPEPAS